MNKNKIDFFLVGAARCGTTFLYNCLESNPNIFLPKVKEPNFFSCVESKITEEYDTPEIGKSYHSKIIKSQSIYDSLFLSAKPNQIKGDVSPSYLWDTNTAEKLFKHNPKSKIIISLRNPIDRAYSHYKMNYFIGMDSKNTFEEALKAKKTSKWGGSNEYLNMGLYFNQVKKYLEIFPEEQVTVIIYEDWVNNLNFTIEYLFNFLGASSRFSASSITNFETNKVSDLKHAKLLNQIRNSNLKKAIKGVLPQKTIDFLKDFIFKTEAKETGLHIDTREKLEEFFREDIDKLSNLLDIDLNKKWF